ncbi:hypothetical protein BT93_F0177 [Corymbia citriodora subsp. variegata]|nr:hypothetical protein BT93_F0177 [Corymbia citriodora subsp. variegata]
MLSQGNRGFRRASERPLARSCRIRFPAMLRRLVLSGFPAFRKPTTYLSIRLTRDGPRRVPANAEEAPADAVAVALSNSLRRGWSWDALNRKFEHLALDDALVERVLLELKEPADATCALGFFHWSAKERKFEHGIRSYCVAINILVRAQLIRDAKALIESVLKRSAGESSKLSVADSLLDSYRIAFGTPLVFDLLVQAYAKLRMFEIGFDVCCHLEERGFSFSLATFNTLINVIQKSDQNPLVWRIYEHMIKRRTYPSEATTRIMIDSLCKEGKLKMFVDMLDRIHGKRCAPSVIVNASLLHRILEEGRIDDAMVLLKRMLQKNMVFDTIAYSMVIYSKVMIGDIDSAWKVHEEMLKRGFNENSFVYTKFIGAYCRTARVEEAKNLMEEMGNKGLKPYAETFDLLIEGLAKSGRVEESLSYCKKMLDMGLFPTCLAFNEMVAKLCEKGNVKQGNEMLTLLLDNGFSPDEATYSLLISGYAREGNSDEVLKLYYETKQRGLSGGSMVFTSLINSLCRCGKLTEAEKYLKYADSPSLPEKANLYETLIACYLERGDRRKCLQIYNEMESKGLKLSLLGIGDELVQFLPVPKQSVNTAINQQKECI